LKKSLRHLRECEARARAPSRFFSQIFQKLRPEYGAICGITVEWAESRKRRKRNKNGRLSLTSRPIKRFRFSRLPYFESGASAIPPLRHEDTINNEGAIWIQEWHGSAENLAACCETLIAGCSKRLRGEALEKSTSVGVLSQYVGARRLSATKPMRFFQQPASLEKQFPALGQ
jgi:hypothetical protein